MNTVLEDVLIAPGLLESIKQHCIKENEKGGFEAVGFLAQRRGHDTVTTHVRLNNHCADPQNAYFVEPWEQFRAERALAEGGYQIVGSYHSHPRSEALPSRTDNAMARPGELVIIYSVLYDTLNAFRERDGSLQPVALSPLEETDESSL
jgi:proteasome lid subunit RPN8/RPN11